MDIFKKINKKILIISLILIIFFIFLFLGLKANKLTANVLIENENIKLTIEDTNYSDSNNVADFDYQDIKRLKVEVDFKDFSSENKKVEINLKEGLTYKLYPVLDVIDDDMQIPISETDVLYNAISSVECPKIKTTQYLENATYIVKKHKSSYGKLTYYINDNIEKITLYIDVVADFNKLYESTYNEETKSYNNKLIEDAIDVSVYKNKDELNSVKLNTRIITDDKLSLSLVKSSYNKYSTSVFASSDSNNLNYGYTRSNDFRIKTDNTLTLGFPNFKSAVYTLYYPKYTKFVSLVDEKGNEIDGCKKVNYGEEKSYDCTIVDNPSQNDEEDNKVIITFNKYINEYFNENISNFINEVAIKYEVQTISEIGIGVNDEISWESKDHDSIEITYYDNNKRTYYADLKDSVSIYHPDSFVNKMQIRLAMDIAEDKDDSTFVYGPSFVVENKTAGEKTNQVVEYEIDPNYEAIAVTFPREASATLTNIEYKTNDSDEWIKYSANSFSGTRFSLENAGISLDSDTYFTAVRGVVSSYSEGYITTVAAGKSHLNYVVYGNLKNEVDSASVTLKMYEKPSETGEIDENTLVESTAKVIYKEEKTIGGDSDISFKDNGGNKITSIFNNEDFHITGSLSPNIYPYGSRLYMDDTEIYIKQPKGMTIDLDNIVIKDENGDDLSYQREKRINYYGDTVYVFKTNKRTGLDTSKKNILKLSKNKIIVDVKYHVEDNCKINNIALNEIISFGNPDYTFVQRNVKDTTDINANGKIDDVVFFTMGDDLSIAPAKKFTITSHIVKDGKEYESYNENNKDTIIKNYPNDEFEYKVNVKNYTESVIDNYEIYIPIAKEELNFGEKYQETAFTWNLYLQDKIENTEDYEIYYSTENNQDNISSNQYNFKKNIDNSELNEVTMIKIVSLKPIGANKEFNINIKLKVDANDSYKKSNKINKNNIVYNIESINLKGEFKGTTNALQLFSPSISGLIYEDLNADGLYSENEDKIGASGVKLELYKLVDNNYEKISNVDIDNGLFIIKDIDLLKDSIYALKIIKGENEIYSNLVEEDFIKNIDISDGEPKYYEIGFIKYELDFSLEDEILAIGEKKEISIKDIKPSYFEQIKNEESAYFWIVTEDESAYLKIEDKNAPTITIEGIKGTKEDVKLCSKIIDKYNNEKQVCSNIKVKENVKPTIVAEDVHILIGSKIEYKEYILDVIDYKENKIKLDFNSNVKIITNVIQENGIATKVGVYDVIFEITDEYGNKASKTIKLYVDPISSIITNPSTYDNIIKYIVLMIISSITLVLCVTILICKTKKQDK